MFKKKKNTKHLTQKIENEYCDLKSVFLQYLGTEQFEFSHQGPSCQVQSQIPPLKFKAHIP